MSSNNPKGGRLPLSQKQSVNPFTQQFKDRLRVPDAIQQEIDEQGLVARWVDANKLYENNGYHKNGWTAFKSKLVKADFRYGNDPEGIIRRGSLILAVRDKELHEGHKEHLRNRSNMLSGSDDKAAQRQAARELRAMAKSGNLNTKIVEGDED